MKSLPYIVAKQRGLLFRLDGHFEDRNNRCNIGDLLFAKEDEGVVVDDVAG